MQLNSTAFLDQAVLPTEFTCKGPNICPPLTIQNVPPNTKSLAIIFHDPDATSGDFTHWTIWNIPATTTEIPSGKLPDGSVEGLTDYGKSGYGSPCPPSGTHHYIFELYALNDTLNLPPNTDRKTLEQAIRDHIIEQTALTCLVNADDTAPKV